MSIFKLRSIGALAIIFFAALGLRLSYFAAVQAGPLGNIDSTEYEDLATKFAEHQPYTGRPGIAGFPSDLQRPPGYPFLLASVQSIFGSGRPRVAVVQCVLESLFAPMLAIAGAILINEFAGFLTGIVYATDWATIMYASSTLADSLLAVLLGAAISLQALAVQKRSSWLSLSAGVLLALAVFVKPIGQVAVIAFLLAWIFQRDRRTTSLFFLITYIACAGPWMARNYFRYGLMTISTIGTTNLLLYTAEASAHPHSIVDISSSGMDEEMRRINMQWSTLQLTPAERSLRMRRQVLLLIRNHWPTAIWQAAIGFARTCFGTGYVTATQSFSRRPGRWPTVLLAILPLIQIFGMWLLATVAVVKTRSSRIYQTVVVLLALCVLCLIFPAASSVGQSRFRVPAAPPLALLAGIGGTLLCVGKFRVGLTSEEEF